MRRLFLVLAILVSASPAWAGPQPIPERASPIPDQYLVLLRADVARKADAPASHGPSVEDVVDRLAHRYGGEVLRIWSHAIQGGLLEMPEAAASRLAEDPRVLAVEQDYKFEAFSDPTPDCGDFLLTPPLAPPPQLLIAQRSPSTSPQPIACTAPASGNCVDNWGLDRIDQRDPRNAGNPAYPSEYFFTRTGAGVKVYVIDGGVRADHREFGSRIAPGYNATGLVTDTGDCYGHGHGTHVAGIIAGNSVGTAKNATIVPVRTTNCNTQELAASRLSWLVDAFVWVTQQQLNEPVDKSGRRPTAVANLSSNDLPWRESVALREAVNGLTAAGVLLVQSAGNVSTPAPNNTYTPGDACLWALRHREIDASRILVVGGSDADDGRWSRSNLEPTYDGMCGAHAPFNRHDCGSSVGPCIDLWAPAAHVVSASVRDAAGYCRLSGTSMAAPHAAGAAALFLESHPTAPPETVKAALLALATPGKLSASIGSSPNLLLYTGFPDFGPAMAVDDRFLLEGGSSRRISYEEDLLRNDLDWSGRPLEVISVQPPANGTLSFTGDGFVYDPGTFVGTESFTYAVSDGNTTATGIVTFVNTLPVAVDDAVALTRRQPTDPYRGIFELLLVKNDFDPDGYNDPEHPAVTFGGFVGQPANGTLVSLGSGEWKYVPGAFFSGTDSVRYTAVDDEGYRSQGTLHLSVFTLGPGANPGTELDAVTTDQGVAVSVNVLANDIPQGGLQIVAVSQPAQGSAVPRTDGTILYTPLAAFAGFDSFTYRVRDQTGNETGGSVRIEILPKPPGPVARPDFLEAKRNTLLAIGYTGLLANDSGGGLTFRTDLFTDPAHGTLDFCCNAGAFKYNPDPGYVGPDSFDYTIQDNMGRRSSASVSIEVVFDHPRIPATTVYGTLGIPAYGDNYFCGDLGETRRTADFICTQKGYAAGAISFTIVAKPAGSFCAYKTPDDTPNSGLSGNWGHGTQIISQVTCSTCGNAVSPTTVYATLHIPAYGDNYFCGDLGEVQRTSDFICTTKGYLNALTFSVTTKPAGSFCAYKTPAGAPNWGLLGNWGHGTQIINRVACSTCAGYFLPSTVSATLGIGNYGDNYFCGDLGDLQRTASFVCTQKGYAHGAASYTTAPKPAGSFCAYKTPGDTPDWGLSGNWGHGSRVLTQVQCMP